MLFWGEDYILVLFWKHTLFCKNTADWKQLLKMEALPLSNCRHNFKKPPMVQ